MQCNRVAQRLAYRLTDLREMVSRNPSEADGEPHAVPFCIVGNQAGAPTLAVRYFFTSSAVSTTAESYSGAPEALKALQWRQTALLSEAVLTALAFYIARGGGSRGARAICASEGDRVPEARIGALEETRFVSERAEDRAEQIHVRFEAGRFVCEARPIRRLSFDHKPFFERDWPDYLTGDIHDPVH